MSGAMHEGDERWLRPLVIVTALALLIDAAYVWGARFGDSLQSDGAVTVLMAKKALDARSPILGDWYYANGDVWVFAPHWFAAPPVAILGVTAGALLVSVIFGFVLQLLALVFAYRLASRSMLACGFAACLTLMAWSRLHVSFILVELSYGFVATLYAVLYSLYGTLLARLASGSKPARRFAMGGAVVLYLAALQNPSRALVFALAPILLACVWPWRGVSVRQRAAAAGTAALSWAAALLTYELCFKRLLTFSSPLGHSEFHLQNLRAIVDNGRMLARGVLLIAGGPAEFSLLVLPWLLLTAGAFALVALRAGPRRPLTVLSFVCIAALGQLGAVGIPLLVGNLMVAPGSIRYVLPSLMLVVGLAGLVAVESVPVTTGRTQRAIRGWLVLAPLVAVLAFVRIVASFGVANGDQSARHEAHGELAAALEQRGLTHGFASYWNANLVTLLSRGRAKTCSAHFAGGLIPYKWNTDATCFDRAVLPATLYVASTLAERAAAQKAARSSLGEPIEHFEVGGGYFGVDVFRTDPAMLGWLELPLPAADRLVFPLHLAATHAQLSRDHATLAGENVSATGDEGTVIFGPYLEVPKGRYRLHWIGRGIASPGEIAFDVAHPRGGVVAAQSLRAAELPQGAGSELVGLEVSFPCTTSGVEARVYSRGGGRIMLEALVIERL